MRIASRLCYPVGHAHEIFNQALQITASSPTKHMHLTLHTMFCQWFDVPTNYLKCTLSDNSCPEWPECQHTSRIRIAGPINRTIIIMNHCQTHLWRPTFHSWHWSVHHDEYAKMHNIYIYIFFVVYISAFGIAQEMNPHCSYLLVFSTVTLWLFKTYCN